MLQQDGKLLEKVYAFAASIYDGREKEGVSLFRVGQGIATVLFSLDVPRVSVLQSAHAVAILRYLLEERIVKKDALLEVLTSEFGEEGREIARSLLFLSQLSDGSSRILLHDDETIFCVEVATRIYWLRTRPESEEFIAEALLLYFDMPQGYLAGILERELRRVNVSTECLP